MLVVSQAVLSCGFSASSPELSSLHAVIQLRISSADMSGLSQNTPSGVFAEGGSQGYFSLCLLPDLDPCALGRVFTAFVTSFPASHFVLIPWPFCSSPSLSAIDLLGCLGEERKWVLQFHRFWPVSAPLPVCVMLINLFDLYRLSCCSC